MSTFVSGLSVIWWVLFAMLLEGTGKERRPNMKTLRYLWVRYGTARNLKALYILVTLTAMAVAGGAPGTGGGNGGN
jgi:hypothetical protein